MTDEYEYAHECYCNASRKEPVGCGGCSCRAGTEIKNLRAVLRLSYQALNDWLADFADTECSPEHVAEARARISVFGTIGYIAYVTEKIRNVFPTVQ